MRKFLIIILLGVALPSLFVGVAAMAEEPTAERQEDLPGALIDQLMRRQAGEPSTVAPAPAVITAESALPTRPVVQQVNQPAARPLVGEENQPLFANNMSSSVKEAPSTKTNVWFRMFGSLAVILLMIGGAVYALRKWPGQNALAKRIGARGKMIEVLSQHHLGPKRSLAIVRVAGEAVLIGITDNNISMLKTLALLDDDIPKEKFSSALASKFTAPGADDAVAGSAPGPSTTEPAVVTHFNVKNKAVSESDDEFAMKGLREIVGQKLRTMKEL